MHANISRRMILKAGLVAGLGGCKVFSGKGDTGAIRVMCWNIYRGANPYGPEGPARALTVIRSQHPDVVCLQESYDIDGERALLGAWLADQLGWFYHQGNSPHLAILSRHPITETFAHAPWHGVGARLDLDNGQPLIVWSCWLDYRSYVAFELRKDASISDEELLACETHKSSRLANAQDLLARLEALGHLAAGVPLIVAGDWNCPSHLDWTAATADSPDRRDLPLPVSSLFQRRGLRDAYRLVHPDPVASPGNTWSPLYLDNPQDRIDRIYLKGPLHARAAWTLPEHPEDTGLDMHQRMFPSDHGAVVVDVHWVGA